MRPLAQGTTAPDQPAITTGIGSWPTGNGDLGNQGVHQVDIARWVLGEPKLTPRVFSFGGRLGYEDDGTTPNTLVTFQEYPKRSAHF